MEENLNRGEGFGMAENLQKKWSCEAVTSAKSTSARPELVSIKSLQNCDAALNSKERVGDGLNSTVTVELGGHEKTRRSGVNGSLCGTETSSVGENSRDTDCGAEMGEMFRSGCLQQLLWGNANSHNLSSRGRDRDGGITDTGSGNRFGANKPQNVKKRKRKNTATDLNKRPRLAVKKHRPKIFDERRPKKIPKSGKKPKSEKNRKEVKKPKFEKKRRVVKKQPCMLKSSKAPLANSFVTFPHTPEPSKSNRISSSLRSCRCIRSSEEHNGKAFDSCSEHATRSCKRALVYDLDIEQDASPSQDFSDKIVVSEYIVYTRRRKSVRKTAFDLNLEVQDCSDKIVAPEYKVYTRRRKSFRKTTFNLDLEVQDFSDKIVVPEYKIYTCRRKSFRKTAIYLDLEVQDFSHKIVVPEYQVYTRRRKSFRQTDFDLNLEVQDFTDKIVIPEYKVYTRRRKSFRKTAFDLNLEVQDLSDKIVVPEYKVYTRGRRSFRKTAFSLNLEVQDFEFCAELRKIVWEAKTLKSQFEDFPITSKKMRTGRKKATAYPYFLEASKQQMLPTVKQFCAAIMEPKSFKCMLTLQPKVISRKKRSKRPKIVAVAMRGRTKGSNSYNHFRSFPWAVESVNGTFPLLREKQSNSALPMSLASFPRRKRSQIYRRKHALAFSTLGFGSNLHEVQIEKSSIDLNGFLGDFDEVLGLDKKDMTPNVESYHLEHKGLVDDFMKKLGHLSITNKSKQIVVRDQGSYGALIPSERKTKKEKPPEVTPDEETMKAWMLLMEEDGSETTEEKYWEEQRKIFCARVDLFIKSMHLIQGNRRFSRWKGSVVDSVVGVFLTQNVSDHLSSNAFMKLAAKFPKYPIQLEEDTNDVDEGIGFRQKSVGSSFETEGPTTVEDSRQSCASQIQQGADNQFTEKEDNPILTTGNMVPVSEGATLDCDALSKCEVSSDYTLKEEEVVVTKTNHGSNNNKKGGKNNGKEKIMLESETNLRRKKGKPNIKQEIPINWDDLRNEYATVPRDTTGITDDSVDWEAVRRARIEEIAATIEKRGMNNVLAHKIKQFFDRMVSDHGSFDLEWLRNVPPDKAKEFLLSIHGIGLKSVECVRLLTLRHRAFPVDTNVGRIVVRLGWVPLQPLPDGVQLHLLEQYPVMNAIQKYLWPRLSALDQETLYELHYQMITFGKVFCTKVKPKCNVCPMRGSCKYFASASASARLCLPSPQEKGIVKTEMGCTTNKEPTRHVTTWKMSLHDDTSLEFRNECHICEPIIEMPSSPEPRGTPEIDIEDIGWDSQSKSEDREQDMEELFWDLTDGPVLRFNASAEEASELTISMPKECDTSKALVTITPEAASLPPPRLRSLGRLHTEHDVYELPDDHALLAEFDKREPDDPGRYLFAICLTGKTTGIVDEQNDQTVCGTILIPCRTANRGRFPLNGTYFQVNEVFADH